MNSRKSFYFSCQSLVRRLTILATASIISVTTLGTAQPEPTPAQIASGWATLAGGREGFVIYNANDYIWKLDLKSGTTRKLTSFAQSSYSASSNMGRGSCYRISPDGKRIAAQNGECVIVCDTSGLNKKVIWMGNSLANMMALSWDGNNKIVYTRGWRIASSVVNDNNTAGDSTIIWDRSWGKDKVVVGGKAYTSVNKYGDFLSFNIANSQDCQHAPILVKLSTREAVSANNCIDGCQVRMVMDSTGTISFHEKTHFAPAKLYTWGKGKLSAVVDTVKSGCGIGGIGWCYNRDYMIHIGDNDARRDSTCRKKAYIRKQRSAKDYLYIGSQYYWPDLWVADAVVGVNHVSGGSFKSSATLKICANELFLRAGMNRSLSQVRILALNGSVAADLSNQSGPGFHYNTAALSKGIYIICWMESGVKTNRYFIISQ